MFLIEYINLLGQGMC